MTHRALLGTLLISVFASGCSAAMTFDDVRNAFEAKRPSFEQIVKEISDCGPLYIRVDGRRAAGEGCRTDGSLDALALESKLEELGVEYVTVQARQGGERGRPNLMSLLLQRDSYPHAGTQGLLYAAPGSWQEFTKSEADGTLRRIPETDNWYVITL